MDDDGSPLSWFGLGKVKDKLDSFCSDVDRIIFQDPMKYAETAGASVRQFCTEFMEEVLPESIVNSLKEKNTGPTEVLSNDISPCPMEMVENESTDSLVEEIDVEKELSFEELRIRETAYLASNANDHHDLPQNPSSRAAEEEKSSDPIDRLLADLEDELSNIQMSSSILSADKGQGSTTDTEIFSDLMKALPPDLMLDGSKVTTEFNTKVLDNQDLKKELSGDKMLDGLKVTTEFNTEVLDNQDPSFGDHVRSELIDLNDGSDERKVEEIAATRVPKADAEVQSFRSEKGEDKCIMMDSSKLCPIPDLHEENPTLEGSLCTSCSKIKSGDESDCEKAATRSMNGEAEFDGYGGNSIWVLPSEPADQSSSETDWVIV